MKITGALRQTARTPLLQVLKTSAAAIIAWLLCVVILRQQLPIFAAIAALLVVQPSVSQSLSRGIERSLGVIFGVALAFVVGLLFGNQTWIVLAVIVIALVLAWAFRLSPGSTNQIPISAMLVLAIGGLTPAYAVNRIVETVIGAVVGLVINVAIVPPVLLAPAHTAVLRLLRDSATCLDRLAASLTTRQDAAALDAMLAESRRLRTTQAAARAALSAGEDSLSMNPRRGRFRRVLENDEHNLERLTVVVTRIIGMTRAIHDNYRPNLMDDRVVRDIARELARAAHDLRLLGEDAEGRRVGEAVSETPALTSPLVVVTPNPEHWILIGSLLEDMRRVRDEIVGATAD